MFLFDVDGTLTPSRQKIDKEFSKFFSKFCKTNEVYLVTGSDRDKTIEQLGKTLYNKAKKVYNCSGNSVWVKHKNVYTCLLYTSPSPRDRTRSRMPSSA